MITAMAAIRAVTWRRALHTSTRRDFEISETGFIRALSANVALFIGYDWNADTFHPLEIAAHLSSRYMSAKRENKNGTYFRLRVEPEYKPAQNLY